MQAVASEGKVDFRDAQYYLDIQKKKDGTLDVTVRQIKRKSAQRVRAWRDRLARQAWISSSRSKTVLYLSDRRVYDGTAADAAELERTGGATSSR